MQNIKSSISDLNDNLYYFQRSLRPKDALWTKALYQWSETTFVSSKTLNTCIHSLIHRYAMQRLRE